MRILFLSQIVPYPPHGGVLQRGYHLLRELGQRARIHLLAFVHPDVLLTPAAVEDSRLALRQFCETVEYFPLWPKISRRHRIAALASSVCSSKPFSVIAHRSASFKRAVAEEVARRQIDLVHVDTVALSQFITAVSSVPIALTHHNVESVLMARRAAVERGMLARTFLRREAAKLRSYEASMSPVYDVNILVSRHDEQVLLGMVPGARTAVVPNGVDITYFTPDSSQEGPALIYTGGMNMFANRDAVVYFLREIWPLIRVRMPHVRFFAVGQDPPHELSTVAAADPSVVVTGYVDDIRPLVRQAAVYIVPLRVGGGTRLKVLDAMAMGKAMVSTSIGCEGIDVSAGEHLVIADTPDAFASATVELLADPRRREVLGRAARGLVERRYTWAAVADQLRTAYDMAIQHANNRL